MTTRLMLLNIEEDWKSMFRKIQEKLESGLMPVEVSQQLNVSYRTVLDIDKKRIAS